MLQRSFVKRSVMTLRARRPSFGARVSSKGKEREIMRFEAAIYLFSWFENPLFIILRSRGAVR